MTENKTYVIKIQRRSALLCKMCLICFKEFTMNNMILTFMFPTEPETLYDSIKVFMSFNETCLFVSLTYRFQYG